MHRARPTGNPCHRLGIDAEVAAATWLSSLGWTLHGRRIRSAGGGEIDILATDPAGTLVAIEVRARQTPRIGPAAGTIDRTKLRRMRLTLAAVAGSTRLPHTGLRLDLVTAEPEPRSGARWRLRLLRGIG